MDNNSYKTIRNRKRRKIYKGKEWNKYKENVTKS